MKRFRTFAFVLCVCLLVTALSGCNKDDKLSAKKEQEIKEAYANFYSEQHPGYEKDAEDVYIQHYSGTYNGAVVIRMHPTDSTGQIVGEIHIAGYVIYTPSIDDPVYVYKDGVFTEIEEAYEKGMLTEEDIADIAKQTHPNQLSAKEEREIKKAYANLYNKQHEGEDLNIKDVKVVEYFGKYNNSMVVLMRPSDSGAEDQLNVAGYVIYTPELVIYAYNNGVLTEIEEAYESGMLTKEDISYIAGQTSPDKYRNKN